MAETLEQRYAQLAERARQYEQARIAVKQALLDRDREVYDLMKSGRSATAIARNIGKGRDVPYTIFNQFPGRWHRSADTIVRMQRSLEAWVSGREDKIVPPEDVEDEEQ